MNDTQPTTMTPESGALHAQLTDAAERAARIVEATDPAMFADPTPCGQWDVKTLLNHLILWTSYSFERRASSAKVGDDLVERDFAAEPGYAAAYRARLDLALDAWSAPEVWASEIDTGNGKTPAPQIAEMILMELVLHGWDLARATGQAYDCPADTLPTVAKAVTESAELYRQYDGFAPAVELPAGDPAESGTELGEFDRVLAVSGRDPRWK